MTPTPHSPAAQGFRMPAEWERQTAIWLAWPHNKADWPDKYAPIPWVYAEIIRHITQGQRVCLLVRDEKMEETAAAILDRAGVDTTQVDMYHIPTNRVWTRDSGPTFLVKGEGKTREHLLLDWKFNAWAKYPNHKLDDAIPARMAEALKLPRLQPTVHKAGKAMRVVLEGGAIDVNGQGCILTTEECMLSDVQARNPALTREELEQVFADYLGATQTIWLGKGIHGDDTHGHVDDITRFVAADTIVTAFEDNHHDSNYALLQENYKRLKAARDAAGKPFKVVKLPMPSPVFFEGEQLPASYANFLITNRAVLVPTFNDVNDRKALNILAELFPDRDVVGIHCVDFVWGLGTIHCASQQQPY